MGNKQQRLLYISVPYSSRYAEAERRISSFVARDQNESAADRRVVPRGRLSLGGHGVCDDEHFLLESSEFEFCNLYIYRYV